MFGCLFRRRPPNKHKSDLKIDLKADTIRWWYRCIVCTCRTTNEVCYIVLLRNDTDQFTVPMCSLCRRTLKYNEFIIQNQIKMSDHRYALVVRI